VSRLARLRALPGLFGRERSSVSICIPTWQSRPFIARTLDFALGQTHPDTRVLVSVDHCDDGTADLCRARAAGDPRVQLFVQPERLGWARNVNFLLEQVRTGYFFLYFHDDVIVPQYTERMLRALQARPDAVSAHCDMGHFGGSDHVSEGVDYPETVAHRLGWFFAAPNRGSPLRSLTRSSALASGLRLPTTAVDGLWANEPYLMRLLTAGPALRVPETLYFRWDKRAGALTDGWRHLPLEQLYSGYAANMSTGLEIIDGAAVSTLERAALRLCLRVNTLWQIRTAENQHAPVARRSAAEIHPVFAEAEDPDTLDALGEQLAAWARQRHAAVARMEAVRA
jgi:glycosyltransferase involved in cell wall biosynthesis